MEPGARPIRDGAVFVAGGRIIAVGRAGEIRRTLPPHEEIDLGAAVLLPGLINAHCHLELSDRSPGESPATLPFTDWILQFSRGPRPVTDASAAAAAVSGAAISLRYGVTCVADVTGRPHATRPVLRNGPLRVVSFGEALGLGGLRHRFERSLPAAADATSAGEWLSVGVSPHAPYTVDFPGYTRAVALARAARLPLTTHLAETRDEATFLIEQSGPFRTLWEHVGSWRDGVETFAGRPVAMARAAGLLDLPVCLLAHVNCCDDDDLAILSSGRAAVAFCPRTHAYFGHSPPHRWREMKARGITVAVGTDSCASSPDLNLVEDLRLLWRNVGHTVESEVLWSMATAEAAQALGLSGRIGTITPGKSADFVSFAARADVDPLGALLDDPSAMPLGVWVSGRQVAG
jgi:cytosine/adenosine deaminase-related metal-dependent hydrolase